MSISKCNGMKVSYIRWISRCIAWDGMLPACVFVIPAFIEWLVPNKPGAIEFTAVFMPIVCFFVRIVAGKRQIAMNNCTTLVKKIQFSVLCIAILLLVLVDALLILSHVMPKNIMFTHRSDLFVWTYIALAYWMLMAIAMYPGPQTSLADQPD